MMKSIISIMLLLSLYNARAQQQPQIIPVSVGSAVSTSVPARIPTYNASVNLNYVRSWQLIKPVVNPALVTSANVNPNALQQTEYFDGLGRGIQSVYKAASPTGGDIVAPQIYDAFDREAFSYLPFTANTSDGNFKLDPFNDQAQFMHLKYGAQDEQFFYGETRFEQSPLNRVIKVLEPGNSWVGSDRGKEIGYGFNGINEVRIWTIAAITGSIPTSTGYYKAGELTRNITQDEHGRRSVEYTDKAGQMILRKSEIADTASLDSHDGWLCTYYVYDLFDRLRFIISPKASEQVVGTGTIPAFVANELCFRYDFDKRDRMVIKKLPGASEVRMVYNDKNNLVFSQDGNMRQQNLWYANLYDRLNRPMMTGLMTYSAGFEQLTDYSANPENSAGASTVTIRRDGLAGSSELTISHRQPGVSSYKARISITFTEDFYSEANAEFVAEISADDSVQTYQLAGKTLPPGAGFNALTLIYYDNYDSITKAYDNHNNSKVDAGSSVAPESLPSSASKGTRGLVTGGKVWFLHNPLDISDGQWLESTVFYDDKAKTIQTMNGNEKGGGETLTTRYDFSGKPIATYLVEKNPASTTNEVRVLTLMEYDARDRLLAIKKQINDTGLLKTILQNEYDENGQLKMKHLGNGLQDIAFDYNIRGWLTGINKNFAENGTGQGRFGQVLGYDYGFSKQQYSGNISGLKWRSAGDGAARAYGFNYDKAGRLLSADFTQYNNGWNNSAGVDFSVRIGNGTDAQSAYDANGNIMQLWQKGLKLGGSDWIDKLKFTYNPNTNQLRNVLDYQNDPNTKLSDFKTSILHPQKVQKENEAATPGNIDLLTINDYAYDSNGNLAKDLNKDIVNSGGQDGIIYNFLNLPARIFVRDSGAQVKGSITYLYDATGNKRQKITQENGVPVNYQGQTFRASITTTTSYSSGFIYESKHFDLPALSSLNYEEKLLSFDQDEGRVRVSRDTGNAFAYDYFIKDHLGNVRMVVTDEQRADAYPAATMETNNGTVEELLFNNINSTRTDLPSGYPVDTYTASNSKAAKVSGATGGHKVGPAIALKVMAGDRINLRVSDWYKLNGNTPLAPNPINDLTTALAGSIEKIAGPKSLATQANAGTAISTAISNFFQTQDYVAAKPKAFVNWVLLDERLNYVSESSGSQQVGDDNNLNVHQLSDLPILKNGYFYVYVSNETPNIDVFFDNLQITHTRGPILEETHYYPFGLMMAGISTKALNFGQPENKKKYNGIEKEDDLSIEIYDARFRQLDDQTGRWWQIDPKVDEMEMWSPYASNYDNPVSFADPLGDEGNECCKDWLINLTYYTSTPAGQSALIEKAKAATGTAVLSFTGVVNGQISSLTFGLYSGNPMGGYSGWTPDQISTYQSALMVGQSSPLLPGVPGSPVLPAHELAAVSGKPVRIVPLPTPPKLHNEGESNGGQNSEHTENKEAPPAKPKSASDLRLIKEAEEQAANKSQAKRRAANREAATNRANTREGNSNQEARGSHSTGTSKSTLNKHQAANARRNREQAAAAKRTKKK